ncbi:MAG: hypothetical protein J0J15_19780, partial [Mesorhizobium sp.]|nr:hypothetical protein [Mesorhizobium sp.]
MALKQDQIAGHPALHRSVRAQAQSMNQLYETNPRLSAVFASQQRWLMAHIGLALHFRREPDDYRKELTAARFIDVIRQNSVASRNTADAFIKEMLHYNFIELMPTTQDGRIRPLRPVASALEPVSGWMMAHLHTLDSLDGASRLAMYLKQPDALARVQPLVADGLLSSNPVREPKKTFSLFTWLNSGGVVMDWLISGVDPDDAG